MNHSSRSSHRPLSGRWRLQAVTALSVASMLAVGQLPVGAAAQGQSQPPQTPAAPAQPTDRCRVQGKVVSGTTPLPGAAIVIKVGDRVLATSSNAEGKFSITFLPNSTYHLSVELTAFAAMQKDLTLGAAPCDQTVEFNLSLTSKETPVAPTPAADVAAPAAAAGQPPATGQPTQPGQPTQTAANTTNAAGRSGRAGGAGQPAQFSTLNVTADANGTAAIDAAPPDASGDLARLLPPGFSLQNAQSDAVAINGRGDALSVDNSAMNARLNAINSGEFDPATGQFAAGFGPPGGAGGDQFGGAGGRGGGGDQGGGGRGGGGGGGGRGGPGGAGGFNFGGRGGRGQSPYQGSFNYTYGGSSLDSANLNIVRDPSTGDVSTAPVNVPAFNRNNAGFTIGGPLKIPGIYKDTNRRSNFQFNYTGQHTTQAASQVLSVPTDAERAGDFSSSSFSLINPSTGQPFANNQIPSNMLNSSSMSLLQYIPRATDQTTDRQNLTAQGLTLGTSNAVSFRLTQNLSPTVATGGRGGAGRGGGGGGRGGGPGGRGGRGLNINLTAQVQYRESSGESFNAVPQLGGTSHSSSLTVPVSLNINHGRTVHTISVNFAHTQSSNANQFQFVNNAAGDAGIQYPSSALTDPFNYGVPNLLFSNFSSVRPSSASSRADNRLTASYSYSHTIKKHQLRIGGSFIDDRSSSETNNNARGTFSFTGLYSTNGAQSSQGSGADFADFLLGLPQQATLQVGGLTHLKERQFSSYLEDNWQKSGRLTFSLSLRYELMMPYVETSGLMANLDATPDFTAASVVCASPNPACGTLVGPYTGSFPAGLVNPDTNNIGPRFGFAYRLARNTLLRGGYSITYNSGSYASIARQLVGQPPFATALTNVGSIQDPLVIQTALLQQQAATTNNFGVDKNYGLGMIQIWNLAFSKDLSKNINFSVNYTGTDGTNLDYLRAPNRDPDGTLRIPDVQPFTWEASGAHSLMNQASFAIRRRFAAGFSAGGTYTLSKSMDDASSLGAGAGVVAQNDQDLNAEWARSNFDQRHTFAGDMTWELPFGANRRWLDQRRLAVGAGRRVVDEPQLLGPQRVAVHGARRRRDEQRRHRDRRIAARGPESGRADFAERSDARSVLQPRGVLGARGR